MAEVAAPRRGKHALTDVLTTSSGMEYSVHSCPKQYVADLRAIFPGKDVGSMLVVPTCQRGQLDLLNTGPDVDQEKDRLLEEFVKWATSVADRLIGQGHFADYIDPCSGLPMINKDTTTYYGEVDALQTLLGYTVSNAGCCKVVLHPKWGSHVYPATLFTDAPLETFLLAAKAVDGTVTS